MRTRVSDILKIVGRKISEPGAHMYHAADGVSGGGFVGKEKRHKMRKALYRQRLRATGMTDNLYGSKEVAGTNENPNEYEV